MSDGAYAILSELLTMVMAASLGDKPLKDKEIRP
jgi:hypothetical protein